MGWETRGPNGRTYYYRKTRDENGHVVSTYLGNGPIAHLVAQLDAASRACLKYRTAVLDQFADDVDAANDAVRAGTDAVRARLDRALEESGYRYHRGEWRRPRQRRRRSTEAEKDL